MGKMKELFKKIVGNIKGTLYTSMGMIKDWNHKNLKEEEIKKWWQEYTEELYQKGFYNRDNQDGMVTHLETDIWDCDICFSRGPSLEKIQGISSMQGSNLSLLRLLHWQADSLPLK